MDFPIEYRARMLAEQMVMMEALQFIAQILIYSVILLGVVFLIVKISGIVWTRLGVRLPSEHRQRPQPRRLAARLRNPDWRKSSIKLKRYAIFSTLLAIFLGSGVCSPCAGAVTQDKGSNEKLLSAILDADAQTARTLLSLPSGRADANAKDDDGLTALMYAAAYAGADCVELLLAQGADPNAKTNSGVTALMLAVGQADKVRLLLEQGAEVHAKSKQGHTALTIAAARVGSAEVVKMLLDHGADLTDANILGAAARSGDIQVVKLLLERGAAPNNRNQIGGPPPVSAKRASELNQTGGTPVISLLLVLTGNIGATPLMYAAQAGNTEVVKLLLGKGADVNARNNVNGSALMLAAQMGNPGIVKLLLENGAELNVRHASGYTPLMYAAASESNDPELIKAFLARGAEINVKANDGETALKLAGRKGRTEIVRLLKNAGAKE